MFSVQQASVQGVGASRPAGTGTAPGTRAQLQQEWRRLPGPAAMGCTRVLLAPQAQARLAVGVRVWVSRFALRREGVPLAWVQGSTEP